MPYYRLYFFDDGGSIRNMMEIECVSDDAALSLAAAHRPEGVWELWNRDRLVRRHDAINSSGAA
jgi:hypothetical protein